jgi:uncharacterized membrane protein YeaQ/YmgE (transglycosylase-associated protein family)
MENKHPNSKPLSNHSALRGAVAGLLGGIVGYFVANPLLSLFNKSSRWWFAPVVIVGFIAVFIIAVLLLPLVLRRRAGK